MKSGLIHIYAGDGKGKTTTATGLSTRATGSGKKVLFTQFLKNQQTGELKAFENLPGIKVMRAEAMSKFVWDMTEDELDHMRVSNNEFFGAACSEACEGSYDLLVLDEALGACYAGLLDESAVLAFLREKPEGLEVVLTGRNPSDELIEIADYVSEIKKIKHPFDSGVKARKGIEY